MLLQVLEHWATVDQYQLQLVHLLAQRAVLWVFQVARVSTEPVVTYRCRLLSDWHLEPVDL
jgi:hypothetical protein